MRFLIPRHQNTKMLSKRKRRALIVAIWFDFVFFNRTLPDKIPKEIWKALYKIKDPTEDDIVMAISDAFPKARWPSEAVRAMMDGGVFVDAEDEEIWCSSFPILLEVYDTMGPSTVTPPPPL